MQAEYRNFSLKELGVTRAQLECAFIHHKNYSFPLSTNCALRWHMLSDGTRWVYLVVNSLVIELPVTNTLLLQTHADFQNAFQEKPPIGRMAVIDKLAKYDILRQLRWSITAYHQSKISEVAGW